MKHGKGFRSSGALPALSAGQVRRWLDAAAPEQTTPANAKDAERLERQLDRFVADRRCLCEPVAVRWEGYGET